MKGGEKVIRYEDECVGPCPQGCMGSACPYRNVPHYYCDECGEEYDPEELYDNGGGNFICRDCILDQYSKISV